MKIKSSLVLAILFITTAVFAQQKKAISTKNTPATVVRGAIFFEFTNFDFNEVNEDLGRNYAYFKFKNIGKGDLHIDNVETSCGCTSADWDKNKVYKQDESGTIKVIFNPKNLDGRFTRTLTVKTDGDPSITHLTIQGSVYGPTKQKVLEYPHPYGGLRFSLGVLEIKKVLDDKHDSITLQIYNASDKRIQLKGIKAPAFFRGKFYSTFIEPKGYEVVKFIMMPEAAKTYGPIEDQVVIITNDAELPNKSLVFRTEILENFASKTSDFQKHPPKIFIKETFKDLGEIYQGEVVDYTFEVANKGKSDLMLRRAYGTCGCTVGKVSSEPIKKGKKGFVSVRFDSKNLFGNQTKTLTVISNDPENPYTILTIKAKIVEPGAKKN
jgi:Protein of unknown function (DUF1573)